MRIRTKRPMSMQRVTVIIAVTLASLMFVCNWAASQQQAPKPRVKRTETRGITPEIPKAKRTPELVFLEHADQLFRRENEDFMVLVGNVEFSKGGMRMFTDSAHYYDATGSFDAFGNVRMNQGDTLFIYGDELNYDGLTEVANLFGYNGKNVRLINRDVKLETEIFTYDLYEELGYYMTGGVLTDKNNRLESVRGEYSPSTKEANFYSNVVLTSKRPNDELRLVNQELYYNTVTHIAEFHVPTLITNKDGHINSDDGTYNTETGQAELFSHSLVTTNRGSTLEGDTLFYDRKLGIGEAWGNMALIDTAKHSMLMGDYGFYNELIDSAFVTGRALAMEFSQGDTLYIHGRYLTSVLKLDSLTRVVGVDTIYTNSKDDENLAEKALENIENDSIINDLSADTTLISFTTVERMEAYVDSNHVVSAWPRVRIFRTDVQGVCDSLVFTQNDSIVRMYYHPVVWSEDRQIFGNEIHLHVNDSTVESATLPDFGFMAQQIEDQFFNQLTGKSMKAWFKDGQLERALVEGSVEGIVYPEENDSTINKLVNFKTANLDGYFEKQVMKKMKMWSQTTGSAIPLYLAKYTDLHLPQFQWYVGIRPKSPEDVFVIPPEMETLMWDRPIAETGEAQQLRSEEGEILTEPSAISVTSVDEIGDAKAQDNATIVTEGGEELKTEESKPNENEKVEVEYTTDDEEEVSSSSASY